MADKDNGSFTTGLTIGLFAGAAGYFLFGTDQGKKARKKLANEWTSAQDYLVNEGIVEENQSLKEFISSAINKAVGRQVSTESGSKQKKRSPSRKSPSRKTSKKTSKKFKGV